MRNFRASAPLAAAAALATLAFPLLALAGFGRVPPLAMVAGLLGLIGLRVALGRRGPMETALAAAGAGVLALSALDAAAAVRSYPVLVNLGLAVAFAATLVRPPSMVERFARLAERDLPDAAVPYLRRTTAAWLCFFVLNGAIALWTAAFGTMEQWALYNGAVAYLLIAAMFAGELACRRRARAALGGRW
jgi:uncharacterized membrane protein